MNAAQGLQSDVWEPVGAAFTNLLASSGQAVQPFSTCEGCPAMGSIQHTAHSSCPGAPNQQSPRRLDSDRGDG